MQEKKNESINSSYEDRIQGMFDYVYGAEAKKLIRDVVGGMNVDLVEHKSKSTKSVQPQPKREAKTPISIQQYMRQKATSQSQVFSARETASKPTTTIKAKDVSNPTNQQRISPEQMIRLKRIMQSTSQQTVQATSESMENVDSQIQMVDTSKKQVVSHEPIDIMKLRKIMEQSVSNAQRQKQQEPQESIRANPTAQNTGKIKVQAIEKLYRAYGMESPKTQNTSQVEERRNDTVNIIESSKTTTERPNEEPVLVQKQSDKEKMYRTIKRNVAKNIRKEERKIKREAKKEKRKAKKEKVKKFKRYTEKKERSLIARFRLQSMLEKGKFESIEEDLVDGYLTKSEVESYKDSPKWRERRLYKKVQKYEDAREDVKARKGWHAFKATLATALIAGLLVSTAYTVNSIKSDFDEMRARNVVVEYQDLQQDSIMQIQTESQAFQESIREKDGYVFDHLTDAEFSEGYYNIMNYEKKMLEGTFKGAINSMKDQELLESIVSNSYGNKYDTFSQEQKRDLKQLAFELLPTARADIFSSKSAPLPRNPIVIDALTARNSAKEKGFEIKLTVNNDQVETVKNLGNMLHIINSTDYSEMVALSCQDRGQSFLNSIVKESLGDKFDSLNSQEKRTYTQIAYELLPNNVREKIVIDPIVIDRETEIER